MILFSSIHVSFLLSIILEESQAWTSCVPLKGALYCLLGNPIGVCLANLHDWECIAVTWPAIVRSGLSSAMSLEKPSIVRLFDDLADKIHRHYETIGIDFSVGKTLLHFQNEMVIVKNRYCFERTVSGECLQRSYFITLYLNTALVTSHSWTSTGTFGGLDPLLPGHCCFYSYHFLSN